MASFGKVLDLLDDRYLNLQDVAGNVEPLPTLVNYEDYKQNVLVYRMDTNHELFMGLIQDFTARMSQQLGKELWTWCIQWETDTYGIFVPSPKKPRLNIEQSEIETDRQQTPRRAPIIDIFDHRVLDPGLTMEEDMLRILIDIVQVDSTIVPNFVEFLYRWIDYYEGDGKALKAALKWEIPSLWDFEYHPLILPTDIKKTAERHKAEHTEENCTVKDNEQGGQNSKHAKTACTQELVQDSPTKKMREKPDLVAMERQTEESERLQYREVKYGIQPPKLNQPLPPLINIPRDSAKRVKYYAACFKSRQRALVLLLEAGISMQQISNYRKLQEAHPRDTPEDTDSKELKGLRHYHKDAEAAQDYYTLKERLQLQREKQNEIAISNKLAVEAQLAAANGTPDGTSGVPLIPPTPSYTRPPDMAADMLSRIRAAGGKGKDRINFVPTPLVGMMKSELFEGAKDRRLMQGSGGPGTTLSHYVPSYGPGQHQEVGTDNDEDGNDTDESPNGDVDESTHRPLPQASPVGAPYSSGSLNGHSAGVQLQNPPNLVEARPAGTMPMGFVPTAAFMAEYRRNLTPEQAEHLVSLLNHRTRQVVTSNLSDNQLPVPANTATGATAQELPSVSPSTLYQTGNIGALSYMASRENTGIVVGMDQPISAPIPLPPLPTRHPTIAVAPSPHRPTLPFSAVPDHSPTSAVPSGSSSSTQSMGQHQMSFQAQDQLSLSSGFPNLLRTGFSSDQTTQHTLNGSSRSSLPPHISRPPQVVLPALSMHQLPRPIQAHALPRVSNQGASNPTSVLQHSTYEKNATILHPPHQSLCGSLALPSPSPGYSFNVEHCLTPQQAEAQIPAEAPSSSSSQGMGQYPVLQHLPLQQNDLHGLPHQLSRPAALIPLSCPTPPSIMDTVTQHHFPQPVSSVPTIPLGIQRNPPTPLNTTPPIPTPNPLSSLAPSLLSTNPFAASPHGIPIQIYFPRIVVPGNGIGPDGTRLGDNGCIETDAFLVGYTKPGTGKIVLSKALFLPVGVWTNSLNRVRKGKYTVLETYSARKTAGREGTAHRAVYNKLVQAYNIMRRSTCREDDVTKRWRASKGPMTQRDRGAVWEGWGITLDQPIEMGKDDREGAVVSSWMVDEGVDTKRDEEAERRRREIEELLEDEDWDEDMEE